jgi:head-tail adaptor
VERLEMGVDAATRRLNRVRAGQLRHVVIIEGATETRDDLGDVKPGWGEIGRDRCSFRALSGRELFDAHKVKSQETHVVEMRRFDGLTTSNRLRFLNFEDRTFNIVRTSNPLEMDVLSQVFVVEETQP